MLEGLECVQHVADVRSWLVVCFVYQLCLQGGVSCPVSLRGWLQVYETISGGSDEVDLNGRTVNARAYCSW